MLQCAAIHFMAMSFSRTLSGSTASIVWWASSRRRLSACCPCARGRGPSVSAAILAFQSSIAKISAEGEHFRGAQRPDSVWPRRGDRQAMTNARPALALAVLVRNLAPARPLMPCTWRRSSRGRCHDPRIWNKPKVTVMRKRREKVVNVDPGTFVVSRRASEWRIILAASVFRAPRRTKWIALLEVGEPLQKRVPGSYGTDYRGSIDGEVRALRGRGT